MTQTDPALLPAVEEFIRLLDEGLTRQKLLRILRKYEQRSEQFKAAFKQCMILAAAPPIEAVEEIRAVVSARRRRSRR